MIVLILRIANQLLLGKFSKSAKVIQGRHTVPFRCWPVDMDTNMHMNNSSYIRIAELSRWRLGIASGLVQHCAKNRLVFIVSEISVKYLAPILPFQRFVVSTHITISDNKWLQYTHSFEESSENIADGKFPKVYATVQAKCVLKEPSGKTHKTDHLVKAIKYDYLPVLGERQSLNL